MGIQLNFVGNKAELIRGTQVVAWIRKYSDGTVDGSWQGERKAHVCWTAAWGWLTGVALAEGVK